MSFIVKKSHIFIPSLLLPALLLLGIASACNKSAENDDLVIAVTPATVAVSKFSLKANSKVLANLDSVFFSIDLNKGVIFNADSLPKGTSVRKLLPVITFANTMTAAELVYTDSLGEQQTVDYLKTQTDSIDFTKEVTLNVTAADGENKYSYIIKVNVHNELPDSLMWDKIAVADLPARLPNPLQQKSVMKDEKVYTIVHERDNSFTLAVTADLADGYTEKETIVFPFFPNILSLTATPEAFFILDTANILYTSSDLMEWTSTGEEWVSIIGPYLNNVLGIKSTDQGFMHAHYPASDLIKDSPMQPDFPVSGRSALVSISNKWAPQPTVFFVGGQSEAGQIINGAWGFDGTTWTTIDNGTLPALDGAILLPYTIYRTTGHTFKELDYSAWFIIGGRLKDGNYNRTLYYSMDNGVSWKPATELMRLPDYIPELYAADGIVIGTEMKADLSNIWQSMPSKSPKRWLAPSYNVEWDEITWDCPYIYLIGGYLPDGVLSSQIWRGVLTRLTFTPLI